MTHRCYERRVCQNSESRNLSKIQFLVLGSVFFTMGPSLLGNSCTVDLVIIVSSGNTRRTNYLHWLCHTGVSNSENTFKQNNQASPASNLGRMNSSFSFLFSFFNLNSCSSTLVRSYLRSHLNILSKVIC